VKTDSNYKLEQLKQNLKKMNKAVVGFSGGVDSSFLLKVTTDVLDDRVLAVTIKSSVYPNREVDEAEKIAEKINARHITIELDVNEIEKFQENTPKRCYYCKKHIFSRIKELAEKEGIEYVLDASNYDDLHDYRPGMKALREIGIKSPLADVKLTKKEIRKLSKTMNLNIYDKPSFACLASRFPYGTKITKSRLEMVEKAEDYIRELGVKQFRVRFHDEIARIEVLKDDFQIVINHSDRITEEFKEIGFKYVTLDIEGYRTGSLNEVLKQ
jgi:uncharacterized protein